MHFSTAKLLMILASFAGTHIRAEEGSLRSALNAISKRQQDLGDYPKYSDDFYNDPERYLAENGNDLAFLNSPDKNNQDYKDSIYEYSADDGDNKIISSAFRERIEEDKSRQKEKFENLASGDLNEINSSDDNADYLEFLHELWEKYGRNYPEILNYYMGIHANKGDIKKRSHPHHYTGLGLDSVGMKKRSYKPNEAADYLYLINYPNKDDYSISKRFPVTKRSSSNYYPIPYTNEFNKPVKRSPKKEVTPTKTDPKVAQDLSNIFNPEHKHHPTEKPVTKPKRTEHVSENETTKKSQVTTSSTTTTSTTSTTKRPDSDAEKGDGKPIQLKKKSIDWSDYFGIDRKKKSDNLDNEWLMERYHKAVAMASKRDKQDTNQKTTEEKINEMDTKLKNIEYAIVDDALKFTGAHEGAVDSKEIQEVKDRVISQLATAYSLEKMRRALGEYRKSVLKERSRMNNREKNDKIDEKRLSVPRKSAEMEKEMDEEEFDNNIKCTDENCSKDKYGEMRDGNTLEYCPKVQRVCSEVATVLGHYGKIFEPACAMHQMCLLCADNSWFSPTRQCNMLFLNKTDYLCNDDMECREMARHSVRYLLDVNHLLRSEPPDTCELVC
ncbi:uncharacterized protein [Onthophagus taurus]|uniref:uncharacterized protein n=1 Tax=Onthophagus taurus TaxID=166361 RepID=UPI000C203494|nr:uncharacterized protein LOC111425445 [Onthophagus taurus]